MNACPICGVAQNSTVKSGLKLRGCTGCGHHYLPLNVDLRAQISTLYESHYAGFRDDPILKKSLRNIVRSYLKPLLSQESRVLDVGCGNGEFLAALKENGLSGTGTDISKAAVTTCQKRGFIAREGEFSTLRWSEFFNLVTFWDVIEHLEDPMAYLKTAYKILAPGGVILAKVPYHGALSLKLANQSGRVARSLLQMPAHIQFFSYQSASKALTLAGFHKINRLPIGGIRGASSHGTPLQKMKRHIIKAVAALSGDSGLTLLAYKPRG